MARHLPCDLDGRATMKAYTVMVLMLCIRRGIELCKFGLLMNKIEISHFRQL